MSGPLKISLIILAIAAVIIAAIVVYAKMKKPAAAKPALGSAAIVAKVPAPAITTAPPQMVPLVPVSTQPASVITNTGNMIGSGSHIAGVELAQSYKPV